MHLVLVNSVFILSSLFTYTNSAFEFVYPTSLNPCKTIDIRQYQNRQKNRTSPYIRLNQNCARRETLTFWLTVSIWWSWIWIICEELHYVPLQTNLQLTMSFVKFCSITLNFRNTYFWFHLFSLSLV